MSLLQADEIMKNLGAEGGEAIVRRVMTLIEPLAEVGEDQKSWFRDVTQAILASGSLENGFKHVRATLLANIKRHWDDLDIELRKPYDLRFEVYASKYAPDVAYSTLQNHMRAMETYVLDAEKLDIPERIEIVERKENGEPLIIDGKPKTIEIEFDPLTVPISKLVLTRSIAEQGKLNKNPVLWQMLADPHCTENEIKFEMFSNKSKAVGIDPVGKFEVVGTALLYSKNGQEVVLVDDEGIRWMAYHDNYHQDHDLVREGLDIMFRRLNIMMDELSIELQRRDRIKVYRPEDYNLRRIR